MMIMDWVEHRMTQEPQMEALDGGLEGLTDEEDGGELIQGTEKWKRFRRKRLTASTFAQVLGMFNSDPRADAHDLWLEKLDLKEPFIGNVMTRWGIKMEKFARQDYCKLTGNSLDRPGIGVFGTHYSENWLAGSPDGLIDLKRRTQFHQLSVQAQKVLVPESCRGLLEIKCPYGGWKGPNHVRPPDQMAAYYMPQVQGLMNIFDRDWCHLFYWTPNNGTKIFFIKRDVMYWEMLYGILAKFWWEYVMPAKLCLARNDDSYKDHEPRLETAHLIDESKKLAQRAQQVQFDNIGQLI